MIADNLNYDRALALVRRRRQNAGVCLTGTMAAGYIRQDERYGPGAREVLEALKVI